MSQFLGPIHMWMYEKIKRQETITEAICSWAEQYGWTKELNTMLDDTCGAMVKGDLEQIIDVMNIHGWLKHQVDTVESRFAVAVHMIVKENKEFLSSLKEICYADGKEAGSHSASDSSCDVLFEAIGNYLLDGMPCDGGVMTQTEELDEIMWSVDKNVHAPYWEKAGEDVAVYFTLRDAWLQGFFEGKTVQYETLGDGTFRIKEM